MYACVRVYVYLKKYVQIHIYICVQYVYIYIYYNNIYCTKEKFRTPAWPILADARPIRLQALSDTSEASDMEFTLRSRQNGGDLSMEWLKGKSTGNHGFYHQIVGVFL